MSDTPEPLAAILAEMREWSTDENDALARYADRIEAAAERERAGTIYAGRNGEMTLDECIVRCDNNSGDDPRGRDVAQIGGWLRELRERRNAPGNAAAMREALEWVADFSSDDYVDDVYSTDGENLQKAAELARAALATPARNCDRFATELDARLAWKREAHCKGDYRYWLFAPAEGGDHA